MIQHIARLRLKPDITEEQMRAAFEAAEELPDEIPGLVKFAYDRDRSNPSHGSTWPRSFSSPTTSSRNEPRQGETSRTLA